MALASIDPKTAVEVWSEWPTVSKQSELQRWKISPFWCSAEQIEISRGNPLAIPKTSG
jgi:hypothetical protein